MKLRTKKARDNLIASVELNKFPRCFESAVQYKEWCDQEQICHTTLFRKNICEDCCKSFKNDMVKQAKCCNIDVVVLED